MAHKSLAGSHLLTALHLQMERMNTITRVCKAAVKKPHNRTNSDINCIASETQNVFMLSRGGPAVHRELCHVVQALQLNQMESFRLPGDHRAGLFGYLMSGSLQIRTRHRAGFEEVPEAGSKSRSGTGCINCPATKTLLSAAGSTSSSSSKPGTLSHSSSKIEGRMHDGCAGHSNSISVVHSSTSGSQLTSSSCGQDNRYSKNYSGIGYKPKSIAEAHSCSSIGSRPSKSLSSGKNGNGTGSCDSLGSRIQSGSSSSSSSSAGVHSRSKGSSVEQCSDCSTAATDDELRLLFQSIDVDGSGAIDVDELRYALSMMGIDKKPEEVQELMDSVDKDGSGELEFEEFVLILTTKLGVGGRPQSSWQQLPDGSWCLELSQGGCFGEAALLAGAAQEGLVLALEDCALMLLDASTYTNILTHGFDGQLNAKLSAIRSCPALALCLSSTSDIRGLAYAAVNETWDWGSQLYAAGRVPSALYIILEGTCKVVASITDYREVESAAPTAAAAADQLTGLMGYTGTSTCATTSADGSTVTAVAAAAVLLSSPRYGLHTPRSRLTARRTELALLSPGDVAGEACLLGYEQHRNSALVSSAKLSVLRLDVHQLKTFIHPADLKRLRDFLGQREEQRRVRLETTKSTSNAVLSSQLYAKAAAEAPTVLDEPAASRRSDSRCRHQSSAVGGHVGQAAELVLLEPHVGEGSTTGSWSGPLQTQTRGAASRSSDKRVSITSAGQRLRLPSTAAGAAAALTAAGGFTPRRDLPSTVERRKATSVCQMLDDLVASRGEMHTNKALVMQTAVAALAARAAAGSFAGKHPGQAGLCCLVDSSSSKARHSRSSSSQRRSLRGASGCDTASDSLSHCQHSTEPSPLTDLSTTSPLGNCSRSYGHRRGPVGTSAQQKVASSSCSHGASCTCVTSRSTALVPASCSGGAACLPAGACLAAAGHLSAQSQGRGQSSEAVNTGCSGDCETPELSSRLAGTNRVAKSGSTSTVGTGTALSGTAGDSSVGQCRIEPAGICPLAMKQPNSHHSCPAQLVCHADEQQQGVELVRQLTPAVCDHFFLTEDFEASQIHLAAAAVVAAEQMMANNSISLNKACGSTSHRQSTKQETAAQAWQPRSVNNNTSTTTSACALTAEAALPATSSSILTERACKTPTSNLCETMFLNVSSPGRQTPPAGNGLPARRGLVTCAEASAVDGSMKAQKVRSSSVEAQVGETVSAPTAKTAGASSTASDNTANITSARLNATPRGTCSSSSVAHTAAKPVAFGVFAVVDGAVWAASETAADNTSWLIHRQLQRHEQPHGPQHQQTPAEQPAPVQQKQHVQQAAECHCSVTISCSNPCSTERVSPAAAGAGAGGLQPASVRRQKGGVALRAADDAPACYAFQQQGGGQAHKHCKREWLAAERGVPQLPLNRLQHQQLISDQALNSSSKSGSGGNTQSMTRLANCTRTDVLRRRNAVERAESVCESLPATPSSHVNITKELPSSADGAFPSAAAARESPACRTPRLHCRQIQQQRQRQQSPVLLPAPLPFFRSTLTTRWQAGGHFGAAGSSATGCGAVNAAECKSSR